MIKALMEPTVRRCWGKADASLLAAHQEVWAQKPLLREIYHAWWDAIIQWMVPGRSLELGAGISRFRERLGRECVATDVLRSDWIDLVCDGQHMPFAAMSFSNIVCVDVVHHVADPFRLLSEVARVLTPGGRFICVEPYMSPLGAAIRWLFHHEAAEHRHTGDCEGPKNAWSSELEVPTRLFFQDVEQLERSCPSLTIRTRSRWPALTYALSGGFTYRQLIPEWFVPSVRAADRMLEWAAPAVAMKALIVLEKRQETREWT